MDGIVTSGETASAGRVDELQRLLAETGSALFARSVEHRDTLLSQLMAIGASFHTDDLHEAALAAFEAASSVSPANASVWQAVATLRFQLGRHRAALQACNTAFECAPDDVQSLFNTGVVLAALGDHLAALHCYERVLLGDPQHHGALLNHGALLSMLGRFPEAIAACEAALQFSPDDADYVFNLGEVLTSAGRHAEARTAYLQAAGWRPAEARFAIAAAVALAATGEVTEARGELDLLKRQSPLAFATFRSPMRTDVAAAFPELEAGRIALIAAFEFYRCCDWSRRPAFIDLYRRLAEGREGPPVDNPDLPFLSIGLPLPGETRLLLARNVAKRIAASVAGQKLVRSRRPHGDRLRIGYLSGDFRRHATACLMSCLPGLHDRQRFEVFVYSSGPDDGSALRGEIAAGADVFCDVAHFDAASTAQRIALDRIDILVDLSGYTLYARSATLALRPAPLQLSYLAYLQTSGAPWIDYALLDHGVLAEAERPCWQEKIAYLPHTLYLCDDRQASTRKFATRSELGLPENVFVFCCLNAPWKIDPETFASWMAILLRVKNSVLWLYDDTEQSCNNLRREALAAGVDPVRLIFSPRLAYEEHLDRFRFADLFLDTFSCNAHTTCVEALAAGLPVLTLPGDTVVARVAASLLAAHGLPELIAESREAYVETACCLAEDGELLFAIRQRAVRRDGSALFCTERRVREIERAYEMMWARHTAGLPPADFDVPPLDA